ncbi:MOSC domain-containing protein [Sulfurimonas aquatica]|uniref:MOSC domain-containing protein n=1 Tax=Sulfurimonas aquatica TaxID=2672570 RepID=A0A975B2B4_9BACT|nr:MOSC domain-containing protein [Sulfurimonas aquatica]QSZ42947.1 MOSC domain-containing protein [Sulfurimonas aquatica]
MTVHSQGKVIQLYVTNKDTTKGRQTTKKVHLDEKGIIDDKFYNKNLQRSILIASIDSYTIAKENGIEIEDGSLGENILIDINPYHLKSGDTLIIGKNELKITQNCTICQGLSSVDSKLPKLLKNDRGIFARYVKGNSEIKIGDSVLITKS